MTNRRRNIVVLGGSNIGPVAGEGFTLLEVLVAISIFSFIALGGFRLLNTTAEVADTTQAASENTSSYKRAVSVIVGDLRNVINRPISSNNQVNPDQAAFLTQRNIMLEFSRGAYGPSAGAARSNAVRIRYLLREASAAQVMSAEQTPGFDLIRQVSAMDGQHQGVEREQLLLQNVEIATIRFMDANDVWHSQWPTSDAPITPGSSNAEQKSKFDGSAIPKAVELDIRTLISTGPILVSIRA